MRKDYARTLIVLLLAFSFIYVIWSYANSTTGHVQMLLVLGQETSRVDDVKAIADQLGLRIKEPVAVGDDSWRSVEDAYYWVVAHVAYQPDDNTVVTVLGERWGLLENERFKSPAETLRDGAGDCEDMAILLTCLLEAGGAKNVRTVVGVYRTGTEQHGHAWTEILTSTGWQILDPTAKWVNTKNAESYYRVAWFNCGGFGWLE